MRLMIEIKDEGKYRKTKIYFYEGLEHLRVEVVSYKTKGDFVNLTPEPIKLNEMEGYLDLVNEVMGELE